MNNILYITFIDNTIVEIVNVFSQESETEKIEYYYDEDAFAKEFYGYTEISDIFVSEEGIKLTLMQPD